MKGFIKNKWKRGVALLVVFAMMLGVTACGSGSSSDGGSTSSDGGSGAKKHKIVVYTLKATGSISEAVDAFLGSINDDLDFTYEVRFAGDDAATFLNNVETAISEGYDGIISMSDKGNTAAVLELCEESGVYLGYTWGNMGSSLNSSDAGYDILKSDYFVGSITSCTDTYDEATTAYAAQIAAEYEALPEDKKEGSIGITTNPSKWTPAQQIAAQNMYVTLTEEYGIPDSAFATETLERRTEDETYAGQTLEAGTWQFVQVDVSSFSLPNAYFQSNPNLSLICSWASITYIEPALQTAGLHGKAKVWTCGFETEDYLLDNFGTNGDQTYQGDFTAPIEAVAYPLALMLDKLNGNEYTEREAKIDELTEAMDGGDVSAKFQLKNYMIPYSSSVIVTNDDEFDRFMNHYVYGTAKGEDSIVTADDLKKVMVTYNADATYDDLLALFDNNGPLTMDAIQ